MPATNSCCHNIIFLSFCYLITETNRECVCTQCQTKPMRTQPQVFISRVFPPHLFRGFMQNCFETVEAATRIFRQQQFSTRERQPSGWNSPASMPDARSAFGRFSREVIARHFCCSRVCMCVAQVALLTCLHCCQVYRG